MGCRVFRVWGVGFSVVEAFGLRTLTLSRGVFSFFSFLSIVGSSVSHATAPWL